MTIQELLLKLAKNDLSNAEDNLYRAKMAATHRNADRPWGESGQTLQEIIDGYQVWRDEAAAMVKELEASRG